MKSAQIGLQLYTVREQTVRDMPGTLRRVAEIGYGAVEFAGWGSSMPREIREVLDGEGIRAIGAHVPFVDLETRPLQALAECAIVGCDWVVVPSVPEGWRSSPEQVGRLGERLNSLGELCRAEGLRLAYHNHDVEFMPLDGADRPDGNGALTAWSIVAAETSPELVDLELDLYWAAFAGREPHEVLRAAGDRIRLVHMKDMAADEARSDAPVGEGSLPWAAILEAAEEARVEWFIIEQDEPRDAFADVERSLRNLRRLSGLPVEPLIR
jgi:sugar phosphate isomerase/epimerase